MNLLFKSCLIFLSIMIISSSAFAQKKEPSPINPGYNLAAQNIGFHIGLGGNNQLGDMYVDCPTCNFKNGSGFGLDIGLFYEREIYGSLWFGFRASYLTKGFTSKYEEIESIDFENSNTGDVITNIPAKFSNNAEVTLSAFSALPYIQFKPWKFLDLRLGLDAAFLLGNNIIYDKELLDKVIINDGIIYEAELEGGGYVKTLQDSEIRDLNSFQMGLNLNLDFNIPVSESVELSPGFEYLIPFSNISEHGNNFKVSSWKLFLELKINLSQERTQRVIYKKKKK